MHLKYLLHSLVSYNIVEMFYNYTNVLPHCCVYSKGLAILLSFTSLLTKLFLQYFCIFIGFAIHVVISEHVSIYICFPFQSAFFCYTFPLCNILSKPLCSALSVDRNFLQYFHLSTGFALLL